MTTVSKWFAELFGIGLKGAKAEAAKIEEAVKNEIEVIKKSSECGCGRSPTGSCLGLHKLTEAEWLIHEVNPNRVIEAVTEVVEVTKAKAKKVIKEVDKELKEVEQKIEAAINETIAEVKKVKKTKAKKI
jgi:hypothetical protein